MLKRLTTFVLIIVLALTPTLTHAKLADGFTEEQLRLRELRNPINLYESTPLYAVDYLNIRSGPSMDADIISTLRPGEECTYDKVEYGDESMAKSWCHITNWPGLEQTALENAMQAKGFGDKEYESLSKSQKKKVRKQAKKEKAKLKESGGWVHAGWLSHTFDGIWLINTFDDWSSCSAGDLYDSLNKLPDGVKSYVRTFTFNILITDSIPASNYESLNPDIYTDGLLGVTYVSSGGTERIIDLYSGTGNEYEKTIFHEVGHALDDAMYINTDINYSKQYNVATDLQEAQSFVEEYHGSRPDGWNSMEILAECFAIWMLEPELLLKEQPTVYKHIENLIEYVSNM